MNRKNLIGGLVGVLMLSGIIGANLVMASNGRHDAGRNASSNEADGDQLECPDQGLPACQGQMNDEAKEGPENEADDAEQADGTEANEAEGTENEADDAQENDSHEDAEGADHQCPPDCDTASGEKP